MTIFPRGVLVLIKFGRFTEFLILFFKFNAEVLGFISGKFTFLIGLLLTSFITLLIFTGFTSF